MADTWSQFHALPKDVRDAVATPQALATIDRLEGKYPGLNLADVVMRVIIKEIPVAEIANRLMSEARLDAPAATSIADQLIREALVGAKQYLNIPSSLLTPVAAPAPIPAPIPASPRARPVPTPIPSTSFRLQTAPPAVVTPRAAPPAAPSTILPVPPAPVMQKTPTPAVPPKTQPAVPPIPPPVATPAARTMAPTQAYSEDDAKEIASHTERLRTIGGAATGFDAAAQAIITQHHLAFSDELLTKRAATILKARLKDIRNSDQTVDMLTRLPKVGGLGLDRDIAVQVVASLETDAQRLKSQGRVEPVFMPPPPPPPKVPLAAAPRPVPAPPMKKIVTGEDMTAGPTPDYEAIKPPSLPSRPIVRPPDIPSPPPMPSVKPMVKPASPVPPPAPVTPLAAPSIVQAGRMTDRPTVTDIKQPSSTLGPAEEMRSLSLTQFRRLGQGANDAANHLQEKFKHLRHESFSLWSEAIAGWRESEVYEIYLEMGRESLERGTPIKEVIERRARAGELYLSEHEFSILADLNRTLQQ